MLSNIKITKGSTKDFTPLPEDVYQVQITDIEEKEGTAYKSSAKIMQFMFKCEVVEGEQMGKRINFFTSQSWSVGGNGYNPSKLFNAVKSVYAYYMKDTNVNDIEEVTEKELNELIGKQLRLTVVITETAKNRVTGFMPIKSEIKYEPKKVIEGPSEDLPFP